MSTPLSFYPRPPTDSGYGFHDHHDSGSNPGNLLDHARNLRRAGVSWYKLLATQLNKLERARVYQQNGIQCVVRLHVEKPHPRYLPNPSEVAAYVAVGARYFEFGNEPNLIDEWETWPGGAQSGVQCARQWIQGSAIIKAAGGIPVVFACTPGGHYDHRLWTRDFLAEVTRLGGLSSFDNAVLGIHPRPHNNPPSTPTTATNTVTWNEWQWYATTYRNALGWQIPMIATEHGYSPGDAQNTNFPQISTQLWAEYNKELFLRFNPAHPEALPPYFLAATYWLEAHGGKWINDPPFANEGREWIGDAPRQDDRAWGKALWTIQPNWNRAGATVPPPPPPDPEIPLPPPTGTVNLPAWVTVNRVTVAPGQQYYKLQSAHWQDSDASGGLHHIFIEQPHDPSKSFNVSNGSQSWNTPLDKPLNEPAGNFAMFSGNVYAAKMNGLPSDTVIGMTMPQNQHVNYFLEYQLATMPTGVQMIDLPSNHHSSRAGQRVKYVILHSTASPANSTLESTAQYLKQNERGVSIHELVGDNTVYRMVADANAAHHAESETARLPGGEPNYLNNELTWGIEGFQLLATPVSANVARLMLERVVAACRRLGIPSARVLAHREIDPTRRTDPLGIDMVPFRAAVASALGETTPVPPPPPPPELRWDKIVWSMEQAARILQAEGWTREHDAVLSDLSYVEAVRERDN